MDPRLHVFIFHGFRTQRPNPFIIYPRLHIFIFRGFRTLCPNFHGLSSTLLWNSVLHLKVLIVSSNPSDGSLVRSSSKICRHHNLRDQINQMNFIINLFTFYQILCMPSTSILVLEKWHLQSFITRASLLEMTKSPTTSCLVRYYTHIIIQIMYHP